MKKLKLQVQRNDDSYVADVETFSRLDFLEYVERDGVIGAKFFLYGKGCYDESVPNETFTLFPGDEKSWYDWDMDITGPTEWDCYISESWHVVLFVSEE